MNTADKRALGISAAGHVLLFAALSLSLFSARVPKPPVADTMDVTLTDKVGLSSAAPKVAKEPPAPSQAPERGPPEPATVPPRSQPKPLPKPKVLPPKPQPAPPKPAPKPVPPKPTPPKPEPKPVPPKPEKPVPPKDTSEASKSAKPAKPEKSKSAMDKSAKSSSDKSEPKKAGLSSDLLKGLPSDKSAKPKGSRLGNDFLKGLSADKASGKSNAPHASAVSAQSKAGLVALIAARVKPCYNPPAGGADAAAIVTVLSIRMNRDGSVASVEAGAQSGVSASNSAYARQMADAARRAVLRCSPIQGLPADLYEGGWDDFDFRFRPEMME